MARTGKLAIELPEGGDGLLRSTPGRAFLDLDGVANLEFKVEGVRVARFPAPADGGYVRLPMGRGRRWSVVLDGKGDNSGTAVRGVRYG